MQKKKIVEPPSPLSQPSQYSWRKWVWLLHTSREIKRSKMEPTYMPLPIENLREFKPSIDLICESLLNWVIETEVNRKPLTEKRARVFLKGLAVVKTYLDKEDLMRLVVYRKQVTGRRGHVRVDRSLFRVIESYFPALTPDFIRKLSLRMPPQSQIREQLLGLARRREKIETELLAAD